MKRFNRERLFEQAGDDGFPKFPIYKYRVWTYVDGEKWNIAQMIEVDIVENARIDVDKEMWHRLETELQIKIDERNSE
jgi:hypothetical protein